jgi:hypothetical protein
MDTIFELIENGDADGIRALLAADQAAGDARNDEGLSPLVYASYLGRSPARAAILEAGEPTDPGDRLVEATPTAYRSRTRGAPTGSRRSISPHSHTTPTRRAPCSLRAPIRTSSRGRASRE